MKLWLLRPREDLDSKDNPWEPWYDKVFGFVVRALDEESARRLAMSEAGDEKRATFLGQKTASTTEPWLDPKYSTCEPLSLDGEAEIVMRDIASA